MSTIGVHYYYYNYHGGQIVAVSGHMASNRERCLTHEFFGNLWHFLGHFSESKIQKREKRLVNTPGSLDSEATRSWTGKCQVGFSRLHVPLLKRCPDNVLWWMCAHLYFFVVSLILRAGRNARKISNVLLKSSWTLNHWEFERHEKTTAQAHPFWSWPSRKSVANPSNASQ